MDESEVDRIEMEMVALIANLPIDERLRLLTQLREQAEYVIGLAVRVAATIDDIEFDHDIDFDAELRHLIEGA